MRKRLKEITNYYGILPQLKHFNSEVYELTEAVIDYEWFISTIYGCAPKDRIERKNHLTEEIADVLVMIEQIRLYYEISEDKVKDIMDQKIDRQIQRIEEDKRMNEVLK